VAFFLRGVNVGGARPLKSKEFAQRLADFGVVSVGAAGTFVALRPASPGALRRAIEAALPEPTEIMLVSADELRRLLAPRGAEWDHPPEGTRRFVSFLAQAPVHAPTLPIHEPGPSNWVLRIWGVEGAAVLSLRRLGDQPGVFYPNPSVEKAFGVLATTRGWETLLTVGTRAGIRSD
jgi:hypothetical protein